MLNNYIMILQYKGTNFNGWQKQNQGKQRTVQGVLEEKLSKFFGQEIKVDGAGRTDKGTHGLGQVANFLVDSKVPFENLEEKIQKIFPDDLYLYSFKKGSLDFHSRYDAVGKWYRYKILNSNHKNIILCDTHYFFKESLDVEKMKVAAEYLIGKKDFKSFMAGGSPTANTIKEVYRIEISREEDLIEIDFYGDGFLYKMVRIMVGMLIDFSLGIIKEEEIENIIIRKNRIFLKHTAPAHGLYLMKVFY